MNERDLYMPLCHGARADGWALHRLHDGSAGKHPFDIGGVAPGGLAVGLEVKLDRRAGSASRQLPVDWRSFEAHQRAWLKLYAEAGALALAALYFSADPEEKRVLVVRLMPGDVDSDRPMADYCKQVWLSRYDGVFRGWAAHLLR